MTDYQPVNCRWARRSSAYVSARHKGEPSSSGMATASFLESDSQTGIVEPAATQEPQQPQIAAVTNGGVGIVPNGITDGPLVHMGTYIMPDLPACLC